MRPGDQVYLRVDDRQHQITIGGTIYNPIAQPPGFGGNPQFYTTQDHFSELTTESGFNRILAGAARFDEEEVTDLANEIVIIGGHYDSWHGGTGAVDNASGCAVALEAAFHPADTEFYYFVLKDPDTRALYLFPTKALAQDQLAELHGTIEALGADIGTFTYDGDTPQDARKSIRARAHVVVTNPDMLHKGILPHHTLWVKLVENLSPAVYLMAKVIQRESLPGPCQLSAEANQSKRVPLMCRATFSLFRLTSPFMAKYRRSKNSSKISPK